MVNRVLLGFGVVLAAVAVAALVFDDAAPRRVVVNLPDGARYVGEIEGGAFHRRGILTFGSGARHEGDFRDGRFHGAGELRAGLPNGQGVMTYPDAPGMRAVSGMTGIDAGAIDGLPPGALGVPGAAYPSHPARGRRVRSRP